MQLRYLDGKRTKINESAIVGYTEYSNVECYKDFFINNVVVARIDLLQYLTNIFPKELLERRREYVYDIVSGNLLSRIGESEFIEELKVLCDDGDLFAKFVMEVKLFSFTKNISKFVGSSISMTTAILLCLRDCVEDTETDLLNSNRFSKMFQSHLYMYIHMDKRSFNINDYLDVVGFEVLSV